ncbi:MAG: hypothetical protein M1829_001903 [Trizodia sp. TS-e1964]|nr:MAG: hypothetical protein M1829_001903 [Trizodia sp. TS-e1964]
MLFSHLVFSAACLAFPLLSSASPVPAQGVLQASGGGSSPNPALARDIQNIIESLDEGARTYNPSPRPASSQTTYTGSYVAWVFRSRQQRDGFILIPIYTNLPTAAELLGYDTLVYTSSGKQAMTFGDFADNMLNSRTFWPGFLVSGSDNFEEAVATVVTAPARGPLISGSKWFQGVWTAYAAVNTGMEMPRPIDLQTGQTLP